MLKVTTERKTTLEVERKVSKRDKSKFPALNRGLNTASRKDFIETEYLNGVKDSKGNMVIRPLNDEEKAWLNKYYEETVVTNFNHDPELRRLNRKKKSIVEDAVVKELQEELKELKKRPKVNQKKIKNIQQIIHHTKKQNEETYADKLFELEEEMQERREEVLLYPCKEDHKRFYRENNSRNNCIFNSAKNTHRLVNMDSVEFEVEMNDMVTMFDTEEELIYHLEEEHYITEGKRLQTAIREFRRRKNRK